MKIQTCMNGVYRALYITARLDPALWLVRSCSFIFREAELCSAHICYKGVIISIVTAPSWRSVHSCTLLEGVFGVRALQQLIQWYLFVVVVFNRCWINSGCVVKRKKIAITLCLHVYFPTSACPMEFVCTAAWHLSAIVSEQNCKVVHDDEDIPSGNVRMSHNKRSHVRPPSSAPAQLLHILSVIFLLSFLRQKFAK